MKQPIKMTPGDELHLTALMAPFSLNLVTGQDRQHLLGYGRAAFEAGKAGQCLHQIQEPAAAEQAAWHAGLDEGRAQAGFTVSNAETPQAAPAAVAVPEHVKALHDAEARLTILIERGQGKLLDVVARDACRAALAATTANGDSLEQLNENKGLAAAPVVLPEHDAIISEVMGLMDEWGMESHLRGEAELDAQHSEATQEEIEWAKDRASKERAAWKAIETKLRALLAGVSAPAAVAINLLAADHGGMKVDYRGLFSQVQRAIKRTDPGYAEMIRQLESHLQELGQRWYAGDTNVVDEILQLYCIERDARKTVRKDAAAAPQAQEDARDAELLTFLQDQCIDLRCFTTSYGEDVGWRTVQHHMSEPHERVVSEVYGDQPRRAIREAMARIERDPYCTGPLHLEDDAAIAAAKGE